MNAKISTRQANGNFKVWQSLYILGCIFNIVTMFIPSVNVKASGFINVKEKLMSGLQIIQQAFQAGQSGLALLAVLFFAAYIALLVMAIVYQKRWIYIVGASLSAFNLLLNLFIPSNPDVEHLIIPQVISYLAAFFMLSGFIAKPHVSEPQAK